MEIGISYSNYTLGKRYIDTEKYFLDSKDFVLPDGFESLEEYTNNFIKQKKIEGIYSVEDDKEVDLFCDLVDKFIKDTNVDVNDIDIIIYTKGVPLHENLVNVPYYIQKKFNIKNAMIFNVEQTCGATLAAINIVNAMISSGKYKSALILSSSIIKDYEKRDVKVTLISDGMGLMYIEKNPKRFLIEDCLSRATGSYSYSIESFTKRKNYRELVNYLNNGVNLIKDIISRNNLTLNDIVLISPQNTTYSGWETYSILLDIPISNIFLDNISKGGHIGDVDTIRNITDIYNRNLIQKDKFFIAYGLGWGTSWNTVLLKGVE